MGVNFWIVLATGVLFLAGAGLILRPIHAAWREARFAEARRDFHRQRERLEVKFVQLGVIHANPHAQGWTDCEFDDDVAYARNRSTGELSAFVAVTIEMEDFGGPADHAPDAIGNLRAATAIFRFDGRRWETDGRAVFDVTPAEAIRFFHRDLKMVGQELAQRP